MSATDKYHDVALACTQHLFDFLCRLLCSGSGEEVFAGMYARVKAALEFFDRQSGGVRERLTPGKN